VEIDAGEADDGKRKAQVGHLEEILDSLISVFRKLDAKMEMYSQEDAMFVRLATAQQKIAKSILDTTALLRNPRLSAIPNDEKDKDFARLAEQVEAGEKKPLITLKGFPPGDKWSWTDMKRYGSEYQRKCQAMANSNKESKERQQRKEGKS
jgi:hypothetical protein